MGLLTADLQSLRNTLRRDGRQALFGRFLPPLALAAMHWLIGATLVEHRELLSLLHGGGDPAERLFGHALSSGPVVAGWIGFALAQRQLFEAPELALWQCAPIGRGRAALQVWLRAFGTAMLWAGALSLPLLFSMLHAANAGSHAYGLAAVAVASNVAPSLSFVLALQIALMRFSSGRMMRMALSGLSALAAFGFPVFLLAQVFFGGSNSADELAATAHGRGGGGLLSRAAAEALAASCRGGASWSQVAAMLLPTALGAGLLLLSLPLHPIAAQNHELAQATGPRRRTRWPDGQLAVLRRKEFAQLMQQPGALLHMLLVGVMIHAFAANGLFVGGFLAGDRLPPELQQSAAMLTLWFFAVLMLLYTHMGRMCSNDGPQWPLYIQSPAAGSAILRAKLQVVGVLLLWPLAAALSAGIQWLDAGWEACLPFCALGLAGSLVALAILAVVGTWPWLVRQENDGRLTQGSRGLVGSLTLVLSFYLAASPALVGWVYLLQQCQGLPLHEIRLIMGSLWPPVLLTAIGFGALALAAAGIIAKRNYRRLLAAR